MSIGDGIAIAGIAPAIGFYNAFIDIINEVGEWRELLDGWLNPETEAESANSPEKQP